MASCLARVARTLLAAKCLRATGPRSRMLVLIPRMFLTSVRYAGSVRLASTITFAGMRRPSATQHWLFSLAFAAKLPAT